MKRTYWLSSMLFLTLVACDNKEETFMVGTLERDRVEVSVESNEPIIAVHAIDGQMLKSGELILEQNPVRLQGILAQQTALRDQAAAHLAELQRGPRPEIIRQTRAQLTASQALRPKCGERPQTRTRYFRAWAFQPGKPGRRTNCLGNGRCI